MATSAGDASSLFRIWQRIVEPLPGRVELAFRLALICTLTVFVTEIYALPGAALTTYVAFFMNKSNRTSSVMLSIVMTLLITIVIGLLLLIATPVLSSPAARVATMTGISFVLLFLVSASKLKPLGSIIALITAYALDVLGSVPLGELATRALLYAWLFVGIPAGVSAIVNLVFGPGPRRLARREFAERLRAAAEAIRGVDDQTSRTPHLLEDGDAESLTLLKLAHLEGELPAEDLAILEGAADCIVMVLSAVDLMIQIPESRPLETTRSSIANELLELAAIFEKGGYPACVDLITPIDGTPQTAIEAIEFLNRGLARFGEARPKVEEKKPKAGFLLPDAFQNPDHVRYALKTTGAAMFCYLTYSLLSWHGIHTAMITVFIVSLGTVAETVEKLALRIAGCLAGAACGLLAMIYLIPKTSDIGHLAAIVFAGALIGGWLAAGSQRIAYVGFQFAFAFFLCVIQGSAPSHDMVVARDRIIGILFGNVVAYLVATRLWPASIRSRIESTIGGIYTKLKAVTQSTNSWTRSRLISDLHTLLDGAKQDIQLASLEPISIRPAHEWLSAGLGLVHSAQRLETPLYFSAEMAATEQERREMALGMDMMHSVERDNTPTQSRVDLADRANRWFLEQRLDDFRRAAAKLSEVHEHA
jgi:multidrug resistance protein MdtO